MTMNIEHIISKVHGQFFTTNMPKKQSFIKKLNGQNSLTGHIQICNLPEYTYSEYRFRWTAHHHIVVLFNRRVRVAFHLESDGIPERSSTEVYASAN